MAASLLLVSCRRADYGSTLRQPERTDVVFIGTLHGRHLRSENYPLSDISAHLRRVEPSVVFVQIPPFLLDDVVADPDHPWRTVLPEVTEVIRYAEETDTPLRGISGFNSNVAAAWQEYALRYPDGPNDAGYRRARDYWIRRSAREGGTDIQWLSSPLYERLAEWTDRARDRALRDDPARPDWTGHGATFRRAVESCPGERIAVVYDARRIWLLAAELESMDAVRVDLRAFLP